MFFFCIWCKLRVNSATIVELLYPVLEMFCIALLTSFDVGIIQTIVSLLAAPPPARVRYGASYGVGLWLWLWPAQRDPHAIQYFAQCLSLALECWPVLKQLQATSVKNWLPNKILTQNCVLGGHPKIPIQLGSLQTVIVCLMFKFAQAQCGRRA